MVKLRNGGYWCRADSICRAGSVCQNSGSLTKRDKTPSIRQATPLALAAGRCILRRRITGNTATKQAIESRATQCNQALGRFPSF